MSHGSWQPLRIDLQAIIKNFIEAYPYDPFEIMVIESVANSLDAKAWILLEMSGGTPPSIWIPAVDRT